MHALLRFFFSIALMAYAGISLAAPKVKPPLFGTVVIVDPGHGGDDPGAHGDFLPFKSKKTETVYEAPYVYDVGKRLANRISEQGGIAVITRTDPKNTVINTDLPSVVLPFTGNHDVYTLSKTRVVAGARGLDARLAEIKATQRKYPNHRIIWISVHFDSDGTSTIEGISVITRPGGSKLVLPNTLVDVFREVHRTRQKNGEEFMPIIESADSSHGMRNLYVLDQKRNPLAARVLIELGNFANKDDVWRLRNPATRAIYADLITKALITFTRLQTAG